MKHITLNVDDLGLSPAVNQAVCRLAALGRVHAASFMSLGRIAPDELAALRQAGIDIGLHFDLTGLARQGTLGQVMARSWLRAWPAAALQETIARQMDAFEDQIGQPPAFIDGHQHVHQFPQVRERLLAEARRRYGPPVALRSTRPLLADAKSRLIHALGGRWMDRHCMHWRQNACLGGVYAFDGDAAALARRWQTWLAAAPAQGALIMCHPAVPDAGWQDEIRPAREREWHWLASDAFAELWRQHGCRGQAWGKMPAEII